MVRSNLLLRVRCVLLHAIINHMAVLEHRTDESPRAAWRDRLEEIVFGVDTWAGRAFDVVLLILILLSITIVMLESVPALRREYAVTLRIIEWAFTGLFTVEYLCRLVCTRDPLRYAFSFLGIVDLLAVVPAYLSLTLSGAQSLAVVRALRLLRAFRVLKLAHYVGEAQTLMRALRASRPKITVFLVTVLIVVVIVGALMYVIEGEEGGFTSIPMSMYWAIVTLTTVGYGDLAPKTALGRMLASLLMILGYGIIAVPTGIVSAELVRAGIGAAARLCPKCRADIYDNDARHCKYCGAYLGSAPPPPG
jgi:voltage-gated potassium channel